MGPHHGVVSVTVGVDIGQKVDSTAIVVVARERRVLDNGRWALPAGQVLVEGRQLVRAGVVSEDLYTVRHLQRLPLGTTFPAVAQAVAGVAAGLARLGLHRPSIRIDSTGLGLPVTELVRQALGPRAGGLVAVTFTHGDRLVYDARARVASLGKAYLVATLQALIQSKRLHLPQTAEAAALAQELLDYEIRIDQDANDKYGAFKTGSHDDMATALGLAVIDLHQPARQLVTYN